MFALSCLCPKDSGNINNCEELDVAIAISIEEADEVGALIPDGVFRDRSTE